MKQPNLTPAAGVQRGSVTFSLSAATSATVSVTFAAPYAAAPFLSFGLISLSTTAALPVTLRTSGVVSGSGFTFVVNTGASITGTITAHWTAVP